MQINKAALEIFDFTSSLAVYSEHELKIGEQDIHDYIAGHVTRPLKILVREQEHYMHIALWENESANIKVEKSPLLP